MRGAAAARSCGARSSGAKGGVRQTGQALWRHRSLAGSEGVRKTAQGLWRQRSPAGSAPAGAKLG